MFEQRKYHHQLTSDLIDAADRRATFNWLMASAICMVAFHTLSAGFARNGIMLIELFAFCTALAITYPRASDSTSLLYFRHLANLSDGFSKLRGMDDESYDKELCEQIVKCSVIVVRKFQFAKLSIILNMLGGLALVLVLMSGTGVKS